MPAVAVKIAQARVIAGGYHVDAIRARITAKLWGAADATDTHMYDLCGHKNTHPYIYICMYRCAYMCVCELTVSARVAHLASTPGHFRFRHSIERQSEREALTLRMYKYLEVPNKLTKNQQIKKN